MQKIEYRVHYTGITPGGGFVSSDDGASTELVTVDARDINSGFGKALKAAREPLGNGRRREIGAIEFWMVKSL